MFHIGHLNILRRARLECDYLMAGVVTDEVCRAQKGKDPVVPFAERLDIVRGLEIVDAAVGEVTTDKLATWRQFRFDAIFKGDDWRGSEKWMRLAEQFAQVGVEVVYLPYTEHTSSTKLRQVLHRLQG
jgi:glycerol-3-phosphate cytidylyltransferase